MYKRKKKRIRVKVKEEEDKMVKYEVKVLLGEEWYEREE